MIYTELKNASDKVVVAKWNGKDVEFKSGETKDMAKIFSPEAVHTVISRFQIKNGLVLVTAPVPPPEAPPACTCGNPETEGVVHRTDGPCYVKEKKEKKDKKG